MQLLGYFINLNELRSILIKKYGELKKRYRNAGSPSNFVNETIHNFK